MAQREWILLNPGPANTSRRVRQALLTPDLCHREPECFEVTRECRDRLVAAAECADAFAAVLFTGSGTAAVEAAICSAVPRGRSLLIVDNGVYGDRMLRIARAHGIPAEALAYEHGDAHLPRHGGRRGGLRREPRGAGHHGRQRPVSPEEPER